MNIDQQKILIIERRRKRKRKKERRNKLEIKRIIENKLV